MATRWKRSPTAKNYYTLKELPVGALFIFGKGEDTAATVHDQTPVYMKVGTESLTGTLPGYGVMRVSPQDGLNRGGTCGCILPLESGVLEGLAGHRHLAPVTLLDWDLELCVNPVQKP